VRFAVLAAALLAATPALAVQPDEQLANPALESRARAISQGLRCLVCQNQSIDDSEAPLARDLRLILRERLRAGDTDAQATGYIARRYGSYVLLKPPVEPATWALWFGPLACVALGGAGAWAMLRRRRALPDVAPLSEAEAARADALIAGDRRL